MLSLTFSAVLLTSIIQSTVALVPKSAQVLSAQVRNCAVPVTARFNGNNTALSLFYDTTKMPNSTSNSIASVDSHGVEEYNQCIVCTSIKWSDALYGFVESIDFDYWHRLDPGLLQQIEARTGVEGSPEFVRLLEGGEPSLLVERHTDGRHRATFTIPTSTAPPLTQTPERHTICTHTSKMTARQSFFPPLMTTSLSV
jgi:hypothetical protein